MFLKCDLSTYNLKSLNIKFDVILVEPPLEEYQRTLGVTNTKLWNWKQVCLLLPINDIGFGLVVKYLLKNLTYYVLPKSNLGKASLLCIISYFVAYKFTLT